MSDRRWWTPLLVGFLALGVGLLVPVFPYAVAIVGGALFFILTLSKPEFFVHLWIFSSIFYAYRVQVGPFSLNLYRALFFFLLLVVPFHMFGPGPLSEKGRAFLRTNVRTFYCLLLLVAVFVLDWSRSWYQFRELVISQFLNTAIGLGSLLYLLYFVDGKSRLRSVVNTFLVSSTVVALFGLYEGLAWYLTGMRPILPFPQYAVEEIAYKTSVVEDLNIPRIESLFHDANMLGVYLTIAVVFLVTYLREQKDSRLRYLLILVILVDVAVVLLTVSRSAILLLILAFLLLQRRGRAAPPGQGAAWGFVALILIILAFGSLSLSVPGASLYVDAFRLRLSTMASDDFRRRLMAAAFRGFLDSPIIGIGRSGLILETGVYTTHSFFLSVMAMYGIVGMLVVGAFLWPVIRESARVLRSDQDVLDVGFAVAGLIVLAFQIVYDSLLSQLELVWLPFSIIYAWVLLRERGRKVKKQSDIDSIP